jgi:ABC-type Fe3+/spermidine/putrescine transport system ATPase subunit
VTPGDEVPVVAAERVTKSFGQFLAVDDVSLEIRAGEFFSMLGPSGCGKTTMLRLIAGFEEVTRGALRLNGNDVTGVPPYRRPVNTVFQNYALFPHLSVFDNVAFGPRIRALDRAKLERRVREMLDVVRLGDFASRMPNQLSGGQRQRVALARALAHGAKLLILDEATAALDSEGEALVKESLRKLPDAPTIIIVSHRLSTVIDVDRVVLVQNGRIDAVGKHSELLATSESYRDLVENQLVES